MSLLTKPLQTGLLNGTIYTFENVGDELPIHTHTYEDVHITIVARGNFKCYGDSGDMELKEGMVIDWEPGIWHGFIALTDNARLVNIKKN